MHRDILSPIACVFFYIYKIDSTKCREHLYITLRRGLLPHASCRRRYIPIVKGVLKSLAPHLPPFPLVRVSFRTLWAPHAECACVCLCVCCVVLYCIPRPASPLLTSPPLRAPFFKSRQAADQGLTTSRYAQLNTCNKAGQSDPIRSNPLERVESGQNPARICPLASARFKSSAKPLDLATVR